MTTSPSLWQRLVRVFQPGASADGEPGDEPSSGGELAVGGPRVLKPAGTRELAVRMVALADALQDHFHRQDARALELAHALDRMGGTLAQLAETQRGQGEYLKTIATQGESAARNASMATDTLARIPDSLLAQAEAIRTVAKQIELSQESDRQFIHSLQHFGQAVDTLGSAGSAQVEALQRLGGIQSAQHETLVSVVREQNRRFLTVVVILGVLLLAGITTLVVLAVLRTAAGA